MLENFYLKSRNSVKSGETEAPYGYVLPAGQPDMTRVAFIVNVLRLQGIEVGRATAEFKLQRRHVPRRAPWSSSATSPTAGSPRSCSRSRTFPTAALTTYDDTGWTMGLMSHAEVNEIADKADSRRARRSPSTSWRSPAR